MPFSDCLFPTKTLVPKIIETQQRLLELQRKNVGGVFIETQCIS